MRRIWVGLAVAGLLVAGGCGDDDGDDTATDTTAAAEGDESSDAGSDADDGGTEDGGTDEGGGTCPEEVFVGTVSREADDFTDQPAAEMGEAVDAVAFGLLSNYTVYLADHEIDRAPLEEYASGSFSTDNAVVAEPDGVLATIFLRADGDDLAPGTEVVFGTDGTGGTLIVDAGGGAQASSTGATGTATIIAVTDEQVCFDIDYTDDLQTVQGTVSAEIYG